MSLLKELEQRLETILEGFFARQFKSGLQPIEIAKKLSKEMDANRTISISKIYVPNHFIIYISEKDAERLKPFQKTLLLELQSYLIEHAAKEGYELVGKPKLEFKSSNKLILGEVEIESILESPGATGQISIEKGQLDNTQIKKPQSRIKRQAYLIQDDGKNQIKNKLIEGTVTIGRATDNTIVISDPNVSRHHARIVFENNHYVLEDLESTNGTFVNEEKIKRHILKNGETIVIGITKFRFRSEAGV